MASNLLVDYETKPEDNNEECESDNSRDDWTEEDWIKQMDADDNFLDACRDNRVETNDSLGSDSDKSREVDFNDVHLVCLYIVNVSCPGLT